MRDKKNDIGKFARIQHQSLAFYVEVLDFKTTYGRDRWLVEPLSGTGKTWVQDLRILPPKTKGIQGKLLD